MGETEKVSERVSVCARADEYEMWSTRTHARARAHTHTPGDAVAGLGALGAGPQRGVAAANAIDVGMSVLLPPTAVGWPVHVVQGLVQWDGVDMNAKKQASNAALACGICVCAING